jgi:hypothetical protein
MLQGEGGKGMTDSRICSVFFLKKGEQYMFICHAGKGTGSIEEPSSQQIYQSCSRK